MGLSRLDNFLKSARGSVIYVDPNSLDATDSVENQGNSLTRPFKTLQRALLEASRFSYQKGLNNDRFEKTTIILYPGDHVVDNRPGLIPDGENNYRLRNGTTTNNLPPLDITTVFDLTNNDNILYKLNSVYGGVIIPRGTSIVGMDLRKTRIRPLYVPDPEKTNIERSAIFRLTGGCYFWQFTLLDADPNGTCYKDYSVNKFVPNFSHHKLTAFEYVDGVNDVSIDDAFQVYSTNRTDLGMYYEKVGLVYGPASGREVFPDYPASSLDINPKIDEYRIVGSRGETIGITSIKAGNGITGTNKITVTLESSLDELNVDTPIQISGVDSSGYDGQFVVAEVLSSTEISYNAQNIPTNPLPGVVDATVSISVDTVTSASPYVFNISVRSVYGMCGLHADGDKAAGFKSMIVAQFTGIGLQKDNNAFVKYNSTSGVYNNKDAAGNENIHTDSRARFKPEYENYHIKCSNDAYLQVVSVFAIGYAGHFVAESGGDQSINNSNSNFGAKALVASGFRKNAFPRDDVGYITHIIPPKEIETSQTTIEYYSIDVDKTVSIANSSRLYLYNQTNASLRPDSIIEGYRIGAKSNEQLNVLITSAGSNNEYSARVIMPNTNNTLEKTYSVGRTPVGINSIASNTLTLTESHGLINGETIRVISNNGQIPDGIVVNQIYYAITNTIAAINPDQIKLAQTFNDAIANLPITINSKGGSLSVVSRVSDKISGDIGHPIQYDSTNSQWYVNVASASTENTIYSTVTTLGTASLGAATPRTYIRRNPDTRSLTDTIYRVRYVIPSDSPISARPPLDGYVLQDSNTSIGSTTAEVALQFSPSTVTLSNSTQLRNQKIISSATWNGGVAKINTELPHKLSVGSQVEILNIKTTTNTTGVANSAFNGTFIVSGISSSRQFSFDLEDNPGTFASDTSSRTISLPHFRRKKSNETLVVYRSQEVSNYIPGVQDGVYHLLLINSSNSPSVEPFTDYKFAQPVQNLYPQTNRDEPKSDPDPSVSFALPDPIGQVVVNENQYSITRETIEKKLIEDAIGVGITDIISNNTGTAHTIHTKIDHGFNRITKLSILNGGSSYVEGSYYGCSLVGFAGSTTGSHANARVTVGAAGTVTSIEVMHGGSAYGIGNTLSLVGVGTLGSGALVEVSKIYNNTGETVRIFGINDRNHNQYNSLYRILTVNNDKSINVASASTVSLASTTGVGVTITSTSQLLLTGQTVEVSALNYDSESGIATVTTVQNHGFGVDNKILIGGANSNFFNGNFVVKKVNSQISFTINPGVRTDSPATTGSIYIYRPGYASNSGNITKDSESLGGRLNPHHYAGITTTVSSGISTVATSITVLNVDNFDFKIGDFLLVDEEIIRINQGPVTNPIQVFRGLLGTKTTSHEANTVIRRIYPSPVELRRNSLIRASSHTFEYLGFGPGNYSTAFPERQDRSISAIEELLAQSTKSDGGVIVYTGMNADGDFYVGNKKVNSSTGQEEVFDSPVPTVTGEDPSLGSINIGFDVLTPLEASISRSLRVEGGPDANLISEFDGPVVFNNKITVNSEKGVEANSIFIQGDAPVSRKYTVGIATPVLAGNPGDVVYLNNPQKGGSLGWVYTTDNDWYRFGNINLSKDANIALFDQVGIGTTSPGNCTFRVGAGTSSFCVDGNGVGIGTTANGYRLNVNGTTNVIGNLTVDGVISGTFALDSLWINDGVGVSTTKNVGIGTTIAKSDSALFVNGRTVINGTLNVFEVIEKATLSSTVLTGTVNIDLASNNVYYFTNNATANWTFNFRGDSGTTLNSFLEVGDSITVAVLTTQGSTGYYNSAITIDGNSVIPKYYGGYQIVSGNANGVDVYTYVIIKTAANTYTVLYSQSQYA